MARPPNRNEAETEIIKISTFQNEDQENLQKTVCLAGSLLTDRPFNSYALIDTMKRAWKSRKLTLGQERGKNLFLFHFEEQRDAD